MSFTLSLCDNRLTLEQVEVNRKKKKKNQQLQNQRRQSRLTHSGPSTGKLVRAIYKLCVLLLFSSVVRVFVGVPHFFRLLVEVRTAICHCCDWKETVTVNWFGFGFFNAAQINMLRDLR